MLFRSVLFSCARATSPMATIATRTRPKVFPHDFIFTPLIFCLMLVYSLGLSIVKLYIKFLITITFAGKYLLSALSFEYHTGKTSTRHLQSQPNHHQIREEVLNDAHRRSSRFTSLPPPLPASSLSSLKFRVFRIFRGSSLFPFQKCPPVDSL